MSDSGDSDSGSEPKTLLTFSSSHDVIAAISSQAELLSEKRPTTRCAALGKLRDIMCARNCREELENWKESLCGSFSSCFRSGGEEEQLLVLRCATLFVVTMAPDDEELAERLQTSFQRLKTAVVPVVAANLMLFRCCVCWMHCDLAVTTALMGEVLLLVSLPSATSGSHFFRRFCHTSSLRLKVPVETANAWPSCPLVGACSQLPSLSRLLLHLPHTPSVGFSRPSIRAALSEPAQASRTALAFALPFAIWHSKRTTSTNQPPSCP